MSIKMLESSVFVYFTFWTTFTLSMPGTLKTTGIITLRAISRTSLGRLFCAAVGNAVELKATAKLQDRAGFSYRFPFASQLSGSSRQRDIAKDLCDLRQACDLFPNAVGKVGIGSFFPSPRRHRSRRRSGVSHWKNSHVINIFFVLPRVGVEVKSSSIR